MRAKRMNEYKIQLESRDDLTYLRDEMNKFLNEKCQENCETTEKVPEAIQKLYLDRVFEIISENCQVNGVDFAELISQNSTIEAVNNDLVTKLQEMQAETENLLKKTIQYRRQVPQIMKQVYIEESGEFVKEIEEDLKEKIEFGKEDLELCNLDRSIKPNFYSNKLSSGLSHLTQLESSIPDVVAKLERAQAVITEEGGKRLDESTQILHRHRRLSRQFDLASKIGNL